VVFVSARRIRALNRQFRGRDYATDVLSFSYGEGATSGKPVLSRGGDSGATDYRSPAEPPYLGDIVISPEVACAQAARYGLSPERRLRILLVHGILHLLGYDHEADRGEMGRLQARLLRSRVFAKAAPVADMG
jgi:probable rRNA maturation factor